MFSAKFNFIKRRIINKLLTKNQLQTLDYIYKGQPFVNIVSNNQETYNLDIVYQGQPFTGTK